MTLVQKHKLGLYDIMPTWAKRIEECGGIRQAIERYGNDYSNHRTCLVGEANGMSNTYRDASGDLCDACLSYSDIYTNLTSTNETEWIEGFLEHWNAVHIGE